MKQSGRENEKVLQMPDLKATTGIEPVEQTGRDFSAKTARMQGEI
jgi:hypothetical protein